MKNLEFDSISLYFSQISWNSLNFSRISLFFSNFLKLLEFLEAYKIP